MVAQDISSPLGNIIRVLCGTHTKSLDEAKLLRLFQLKCWLLDDRPDDGMIFKEADAIFATLSITRSIVNDIEAARRKQEDVTAVGALEELIDDDEFRAMFNRAFRFPPGFRTLANISHISDEKFLERRRRQIKSISVYIAFCMRTAADPSIRDFKTTSKKLYAHAAASNAELFKDLTPLLTSQRQRLSFLYVAHECNKELMTFEKSGNAIWKMLITQSHDVESLKSYFARCAYVQRVIAHGQQVKCKQIEGWAGRGALRMSRIKKISKGELAAAEEHYIASAPA